MSELVNLEDLWLGTNSIQEVPLSLTKAKKLDWAHRYLSTILDENPIEKPPLPVCRIGFKAIKNWYEKQVNTFSRKIDRLKINKYRSIELIGRKKSSISKLFIFLSSKNTSSIYDV
jgi:hypothetical protein